MCIRDRCTTAFAITFGLIGSNLFKKSFPVIATTDLSYVIGEKTSLMDTIVNIFPSNFISPMAEANMLQVIVMAIDVYKRQLLQPYLLEYSLQ